MRRFLAFFGLVITVLALIHIEAAVSIEMFTQPWPVRKGLNIISCLEFEKAKELNKKVCSVAYNKYEPDGIRYNFVVGVNLCSNSTDMTNSVQWNERMLKSGKYEMYEGTWFIGIHVVEEDNKTKYFCHALGPEYRGAIQIQLIYAEGLNNYHSVTNLKTTTETMAITKLVQPTTNQVSAGKKTTEENTPSTTLAQPTTNRVTEGKKTAEGEPNESDKGNSCSVCAVTGSLSTLALVVICSLLYLCRERLLTSAVHLFDCQREVGLGDVSADNSSRLSSDDVLDGEEFWRDGNCRSLAELRTTSDDIRVKCSDNEATSSGTQESYPDPLPHTCTYNVTSSL